MTKAGRFWIPYGMLAAIVGAALLAWCDQARAVGAAF
jgi:hypothetical protein